MRTIIFDFGNVVGFFDHNRTLERLRPHTPFTPAEIFALVYNGKLEDYFERGYPEAPEFLQQVIELCQLRCNAEFLESAIADVFSPNPEVCELIPKLAQHYQILLGSNTNAIHSTQFRAQFADVLSYFDGLVLSHEIGVRKPEAEFFLRCHRLTNATPAECVFVDDLTANIHGARGVGFRGIIYRPNEGLAEQLRALGVTV